MITDEKLDKYERMVAPHKAIMVDMDTVQYMSDAMSELIAEIRRLRDATKLD